MADHYKASIDYCARALEARDALTDLYGDPHRTPQEVAALNGDLGDALKLAEVHGLLAIAQRLDDLSRSIESGGGVDLVGLMRP